MEGKKASRAIHQSKCRAESKRFWDIMQRNNQKLFICEIYLMLVQVSQCSLQEKLTHTNKNVRMAKSIKRMIGDQRMRNDDAVMLVKDEDKKIAWKNDKLFWNTG